METFRKTTHLSEIIEASEKSPAIIFIYSNSCNTSAYLEAEIEKNILEKKIKYPVYQITVQTEPSLSKRIEEYFAIKHESPQIIILDKGKVILTAHHKDIQIQSLMHF